MLDLFVQALILYSLVSLTIETIPDLSPDWRAFFRLSEIVVVLLFTAEYLLRIWVADRPLKFMFSVWGIIDLLAILPFYIASGVDLRGIRIIRLFRVFRLLKMARYNRALHRLADAIRSQREEFTVFLGACGALIYLSAVGIYYFERDAQPEVFSSIPESLWWAIATLTTVGYGDAYPITTGGRVFTAVVVLLGMGIIAVPAGLLASALTRRDGPISD